MYFSGSNVSIVATADNGDYIELDAAFFQFQASRAKLPIYGYKSTRFDTVADGEELVQGQFLLNFDAAGQLAAFAAEHKFEHNPASLDPQDLVNTHLTRIDLYYSKSPDDYQQYTILDVHMQSLGQSISSGGEPIGESYNFLARGIGHARSDDPERPAITVSADETLYMPEDLQLNELDFTEFDVWEPMAPNINIVTVHFQHLIYPLIWAREISDGDGNLTATTTWDWFKYGGYDDRDPIIAGALGAELTATTGPVRYTIGVNPQQQAPSSQRVWIKPIDIPSSQQFNLARADMELREESSTGLIPESLRSQYPDINESLHLMKIYYAKDFLQATEAGNQFMIGNKYRGMSFEATKESLATQPGLHVISVTKISFPIHYLVRNIQAKENGGWKWISANEDLTFETIDQLATRPEYVFYSNGKNTFFEGTVDLRSRDIITDSTLIDFLSTNTGVDSTTWAPSPKP